ncbi:MAG TPA: hypothetical protein PLC87_11895 [Bacteroidales bacterium]|nr:hypothetical protein [Bacteroidales bacterium]
MHYVIIILIIVGIVIWQFYVFNQNLSNISFFKEIFPKDPSDLNLIKIKGDIPQINTRHENDVLKIIITSINNYLRNNKGAVSDYHLMKDIVERNCDTKEEEIHTQVPVPLYLGLAGTMLGILNGIGFLVFSGGLDDLLNTENGAGSKGIETLLGGVALAMISSIIGITLTTIGSQHTKNAKTEVEKNKNTFLSWIQAELLPKISSDVSIALNHLAQNLVEFNITFYQNTNNFKDILEQVTESYQKQKELMQYINRLKITEIATANIAVYDKLKNSTNEIGVFAEYLSSLNEYLSNVQSLNKKLDDYEKRTQVIEDAGKFFLKNEKWLAENIDNTNIEVQKAIMRFEERTKEYLLKLQESLNGQILSFDSVLRSQQEKLQEALTITTEIVTESFTKTQQTFEKAITEQQSTYQNKLNEFSKIVEEIKNLTHIKEGIKEFKEATNRQNSKIDELTKEIRHLALAKTESGSIKQIIRLPKWIRVLIIAGSSILILSCLFYVIPLLIDLITKLINGLF